MDGENKTQGLKCQKKSHDICVLCSYIFKISFG
jgi:hypothetical protein